MAIKALMLRRRIDLKKAEQEEIRAKQEDLDQREAELAKAIEEVRTAEEQEAAQHEVDKLVAERAGLNAEAQELERTIQGLEEELAAEEQAQETGSGAPQAEEKEHGNQERGRNQMENRAFERMSYQEREALAARDDVRSYLHEVRTAIREKRAITNVGLTIPQVMLGILREKVEGYSKLYRHVTVRQVRGEARMLVMGTVPEAIWTDCCASLNELTMGFNDMEMDCYKVAGYFSVCNANMEDSDLALLGELMDAIGQAMGLALDKAILYGRNAATTKKMPQGIVSRLAQTEQPDAYPPTARPWADLHTSNIVSITAANSTGAKLIQGIVKASGKAKGKYSRGGMTWVMSEATYTSIMAETISTTADGRIVAGVSDKMPVVGGDIVKLPFMPENVIVGGYFDTYILAERAGAKFASSEHVRFLQDQTVLKGTARYDGAPAIAEAFVAIGINGTTPNATMAFPEDTANTGN